MCLWTEWLHLGETWQHVSGRDRFGWIRSVFWVPSHRGFKKRLDPEKVFLEVFFSLMKKIYSIHAWEMLFCLLELTSLILNIEPLKNGV